jgi:hypothetical protein
MNGEALGQTSTYLTSFKIILGRKDPRVFAFSALLACLNAMTKIDLLAHPPKKINYTKKLFFKLALAFLVPYPRVNFRNMVF